MPSTEVVPTDVGDPGPVVFDLDQLGTCGTFQLPDGRISIELEGDDGRLTLVGSPTSVLAAGADITAGALGVAATGVVR